MPRTNYKQGKRLRELARAQKQEEKAARRKERKENAVPGAGPPILEPQNLALDDDLGAGGAESEPSEEP